MNDKVSYLRDEYRQQADELGISQIHKETGGGSEPPGGPGLEKRVEKLETAIDDVKIRMIRIEAKFDSFSENASTKADIHELAGSFHKSMNEQTWKFLAGATSMAALFSTIAFALARSLS